MWGVYSLSNIRHGRSLELQKDPLVAGWAQQSGVAVRLLVKDCPNKARSDARCSFIHARWEHERWVVSDTPSPNARDGHSVASEEGRASRGFPHCASVTDARRHAGQVVAVLLGQKLPPAA